MVRNRRDFNIPKGPEQNPDDVRRALSAKLKQQQQQESYNSFSARNSNDNFSSDMQNFNSNNKSSIKRGNKVSNNLNWSNNRFYSGNSQQSFRKATDNSQFSNLNNRQQNLTNNVNNFGNYSNSDLNTNNFNKTNFNDSNNSFLSNNINDNINVNPFYATNNSTFNYSNNDNNNFNQNQYSSFIDNTNKNNQPYQNINDNINIKKGKSIKYKPTKRKSSGKTFLLLFVMIVAIFGLSWALREFVFQAYEIPSGSMESTIMTGDMVFAEKITPKFSSPNAGEIVTFYDPQSSVDIGSRRILIKRVIATEGQTVDIKNNKLYIDDVEQHENYVNGLPTKPVSSPNKNITFPYEVPEGYIFVMGDNRTNSADSRVFGAVPVDSVIGHALFIYWPYEDWKVLE